MQAGQIKVRIHIIIVMMRSTGLAPWEFELPFPGSLTSTFLGQAEQIKQTMENLRAHMLEHLAEVNTPVGFRV